MLPSLAALLTAALVAAAPATADERAAAALPRYAMLEPIPEDPLTDAEGLRPFDVIILDLLLPGHGAMPPAPTVIARPTRYYGTVTFDHAGHVARRARCETCHGPGRVTKVFFTPKLAHERCIGCHKEEAKGPTRCQTCHVKTAPPPTQLAATPSAPAQPPPPPAPNPANVAAALAAFATPHGKADREAFQHHIEVGLSAGRGPGVSVRHASHQDFYVFTQSLEQLRADNDMRTLGLLAGGVSRSFRPGVFFEAAAVAGFDLIERPVLVLLPAIGARAVVEWRQPTPFLQHVAASLTGVFDLSGRATERDVGRVTIYATVATGFQLR